MAITVVRGPDTGAKFELTSSRIVIGRKRGEVMLKDRETSSLHASIEFAPDGRFILKDLGSTNGTWLEGKRVTVAEIRPGQHLKVGANHLLFGLVDASTEATRQGRITGEGADVSFPSPWAGGASAQPPQVVAGPGPLDVDLGMPDLPPAQPPVAEPLAPPPAAGAWPAPPPVASPMPAPARAAAGPPAAPVDPLSRTSPGISARTLPERQRVESAPPLPPLPPWPGAPTERSTQVSPIRPIEPPPAPPAEPPPAPVPAPPPPAPAGGLPPGVERSVYGIYLIVERGRDRGRAFPINRQVTVLGRSGTEILINDPDISRRHAALDVQGEGKYVLRDLNSTNGTLLNGVAVQSERIAPNDKIRLGSTTIKLVVGDDKVVAELARLAGDGTNA